jgi:putative tricarboxylic transport membrane protein
MDVMQNVFFGLQVCLQPENLLYCFIGVLIGTLIGVLPGIGPMGAMSILLPATYGVTPVGAIIMMGGIFYGAQYGGSTTSILVNIPGEVTSIATCLDGYQLAKKGRAGPALGMAAVGSFIGATIVIVVMMFVSNPLAKAALNFGPPEYFALVCVGLVILTLLTQGSTYKGLMMALLGILLGTIGMDLFAVPRFTFGLDNLLDGLGLAPMVMGLFGVSEVLINIEQPEDREIFLSKIRGLLPNFKDWMASKWAILRGTVIGFFLGILPGGGATISAFAAYAMEKRFSKYPERFGTGVIEGVAAPETANNAAAQASFIPLLSLGIPTNPVMAILFGGLLIHGIQPGPLLIRDHPEMFRGVIMSMYLGNIMLLALNLPLIGIWVKILRIPYNMLFPLILFFCLIGSYSISNSTMDIYILVLFGFVGYLMRKLEFEAAPLTLAYVLSNLLEVNFRQSLILSDGSLTIFFTRPISAVFIIAAVGFLTFNIFHSSYKRKLVG